jgi:hypothetical protein
MTKTILSLAATAALLAACGGGGDEGGQAQGDTTAGPVVSSSETPRNPAVDTTPTTGDQGQTPGANSFTEGQARGAIESAGYTDVGTLTQNAQGLWQGQASKGGAQVNVSVDYKGAVTQQ